jgi:hypothetical protein
MAHAENAGAHLARALAQPLTGDTAP